MGRCIPAWRSFLQMSLVVVGPCIGNSMFSSGAVRAPPFFNLLLKILLKNNVCRSEKKKKRMYKAREKSPEIKVTIVYPQMLVVDCFSWGGSHMGHVVGLGSQSAGVEFSCF